MLQADAQLPANMAHVACRGCVLVVEDDDDTREALCQHLGRLGCTVLAAADGLEALRMLRDEVTVRPCLLLTDLNMPNLGGVELACRARACDRDASMPVVTMSAEPNRERPPDVEGHLAKPFPLAELGSTIARLCQGGPARDRALRPQAP